MDSDYTQTREYAFPADFPAFANPYADGVFHGEALTVVGSKLYALFYVNKGSGYATYYDSVVARFAISARGTLTYDNAYVKSVKIPLHLICMIISYMSARWAECRMLAAAMLILICASLT